MLKLIQSHILILSIIGSSSAMSEPAKLTGKILFTSGGDTISVADLNHLTPIILGKSSDFFIESIAQLSEKIIFAGCYTHVAEQHWSIKKFDINTKTFEPLRSGKLPAYFSKSNTLLFYDSNAQTKETWLYSANINEPDLSHPIAKAPEALRLPNGLPYPLIAQPVKISDDEVIFLGSDYALWKYQVSTSSLNSTGINKCIPTVWRVKAQQLVCYDWESQEYSLYKLGAGSVQPLPQLKKSHGLVYLPTEDAILFGRTHLFFLAEKDDIFVYDFKTNTEFRVIKNAYISNGILFQ